ncbi:peptidase M28-like protein [Larkinella arboricola]|uniref:Peptidase M28-like protein n=1 Tax=Larkinella arboricola TaxID=643671 RepID=A0A327X8R0_LARAB|nr:M28 family peptidase [Larkinella arboricola]RAK02052.1 peptidase M28-like protein [Larkinella arboricola]
MLKTSSLLFASLLLVSGAVAQPVSKLPESKLNRSELEAQMRFLAADELQGRRTGEPGNMVAARYIAEQFRALGLKPVSGQSDYFQKIPFLKARPATYASLQIGGMDSLKLGRHFVVISGPQSDIKAETVYIGYGLTDGADGYNGRNVRGKLVVAQVGSPDATTNRGLLAASEQKRKLAAEKGAVGLVELYTSGTYPWPIVTRSFQGEQLSLASSTDVPTLLHIWVDNGKNQLASLKDASQTVSIRTSGREQRIVEAVNVAGVIEGTDPKLKNEYVLLSAHFDHVGVGKQGGQPYTAADSIFNGARDNAFGTVALLASAKALQAQRPKRSILFLALTGEELGLLGSRYYAEHPLVPLKQTVFNLNSDGAGYNDTTIVSVIGLNRTGAKTEIETASKAFGLGVFADPAPEQNLFDRSDNVNFAVKGIPAPTFSAGFKTFDADLFKYYHQAADNPDTIDYGYLLKFCKAFAYTARLIADKPTRPQWVAGDKYEAAAKALYGTN